MQSSNRYKRSAGEARQSRVMEDRAVTESRPLGDGIRREELASFFRREVLPTLPDIPGYHVMWFSTNHVSDKIHDRLRAGYTVVKPEDVPEWDPAMSSSMSLKTGDYAGAIGTNEMIALKIPIDRYRYIEHHFNEVAPQEEESKMNAMRDALRDMVPRSMGRVEDVDHD